MKCVHTQDIKNYSVAVSYLLILRCLVAIAEQLEAQVLVLLEKILKFILLGKRGREKKMFRAREEVTMIRPEHSTAQHSKPRVLLAIACALFI